MKNFTKVLFLLSVSLLVFPLLVLAADFKAGQQTSLASTERAKDNLYMAGGSVVSAGSADKDLLIAGGTALVSGPVSGDLFIAGGNVTVLGQVSGDARIAGGNIIVSGNILGDAVVGGGQVVLSGKSVGGDVLIAGGTVRIDSEVKGSVRIAGGEIYINGPVAGDVYVKGKNLTLGPNADIKGNLKYEALKSLTTETGGKVHGETIFTQIKGQNEMKKNIAAALFAFFTIMFIAKFFMILAASLFIGLVFRRYSSELVAIATARPLSEVGRGLVTMIVLPVLSILLMITVVGIPFGIFGLLSFVLLMIYANIIAPILIGALAHKWMFRSPLYMINWKTILLGTVVYFVLGLIPFLGWIVNCVLVLMTLGATINIKSQVLKEWR
jgi:cytoskeletal protein CcmA (bactofilin family)